MEHMKEVIKQLAGAIQEQTKTNVDVKSKFEEDNKVLIEAFKTIGITLRDENGDYRNIYDVLKDMSGKYEQLYGGKSNEGLRHGEGT